MSSPRYPQALALLVVAGAVAACGEHEFEPPSQEERTARADSVYSSSLFDSIAWASDSLRLQSGNLVFADDCRRCHGPLGRGDTEYARNNNIDVPSLVEPDWKYAGDMDSVRHRIFVGHRRMPNWGVVRLTPRQIDAAASYILDQLRPDVLADTLDSPAG